jgi:hypothetical protein
LRRKSVTTSGLLGYAHSIAVDVPQGAATVVLEMPGRDLAATVRLNVADAAYLEFSVVDGRILHHAAD